MSHIQKQESTDIFDIAQKSYEYRSHNQHKIITDFLQSLFQSLNSKTIKLISFYIQRIAGPIIITSKQFISQSIIIIGSNNDKNVENPQAHYKMHTLTRDKKINVQENQQALVIDYTHYLNCQALGQSSVQQEIAFMHSSQFLCSIPKRRLYYILRKSVLLRFSISQVVYKQGQQIEPGQSGSGVYLVRKGDFGYFKYFGKQGKQVQSLGFSRGHLFGTLELNQKNNPNLRQFTVRCKSHFGLIYQFSQQLFTNHIKPYCQNVINNRQQKLVKYMSSHIDKSEKIRTDTKNNPFLSQTLTRGFNTTRFSKQEESTSIPKLTRTRLSLPHVQQINLKPLLSQRLQQQGLRKTNYFSLMNEGPLKVYPMTSQRSNFTQSQFRQLNRLERNKQACEKIKILKQRGKCAAAKGQILFSFFKQTWNFDKQKRAKLTNRRYV